MFVGPEKSLVHKSIIIIDGWDYIQKVNTQISEKFMENYMWRTVYE